MWNGSGWYGFIGTISTSTTGISLKSSLFPNKFKGSFFPNSMVFQTKRIDNYKICLKKEQDKWQYFPSKILKDVFKKNIVRTSCQTKEKRNLTKFVQNE